MNEYVANILGQPQALRSALEHFEREPFARLGARIQGGEFDRIILTGMGASLYVSYPAWLLLAQAGLPAWWVETGELLQSARALITPRSLVWLVSQSGRGPEQLDLLDAMTLQPARLVLATTNDSASPLAQRASLVLPLYTAAEKGVATRSYVNTLALTQLAAQTIAGQDVAPGIGALHHTASALEDYLSGWEDIVASLGELLPNPDRLILVGWGASLAAALDGALVLKEAARASAEGMSTGQFRHGPLELADSHLTVLVFDGPEPAATADRQLAQTIAECGARALRVSVAVDATRPALAMPAAQGLGLPIAQIVPIQLLSLYLARLGGFEAAAFRHLGKITWPSLRARRPADS